jgi:hypothetical protein
MYSKMLYMKTRVTFRVEDDLAQALRELPNQTRFVEDALRDALGRTCPVCRGDGRLPARTLRVANVRARGIERLNRVEAQQLQKVFRLAKAVAATRIDLQRRGARVAFSLRRDEDELLDGVLDSEKAN